MVFFCRVSEIVSEDDLKFLIDNLEENPDETEKWEMVTERRNNAVYYTAKCCRPKVSALMPHAFSVHNTGLTFVLCLFTSLGFSYRGMQLVAYAFSLFFFFFNLHFIAYAMELY